MLFVFGVVPNVIALPSLELFKFVSIDKINYQEAITIDVPANVYYKYEITNVGDVSIHDITVFDDQLGLIVDSVELFSGGAFSLSDWPAFIGEDTTNTATVTGMTPQGALVQAFDSATVYVNNPVPEPTTMLLFGAGLVGLAGFGRKKFKK